MCIGQGNSRVGPESTKAGLGGVLAVFISLPPVTDLESYQNLKLSRLDLVYSTTLIERIPPHRDRGGFLFTMFSDQEPCVRDFMTRCDGRISS